MIDLRKTLAASLAPLAIAGLVAAPIAATAQNTDAEQESVPAQDGNTAGTSAAAEPQNSMTTASDLGNMAGGTVVSSDGVVLGTVSSATVDGGSTVIVLTPDTAMGMSGEGTLTLTESPSMDSDGRYMVPMSRTEFESSVQMN
ncbi:hypothetical protein [Frigidibacter oleivorans]|uniref:hypothetical protein n=1 Tax=Frigidibacter oleivorans TaxID=2487129 RepID=UPI000F8E66EC|nr:hypothetical protein [Frigidibacter oleivorans]